MKPHPDLHTRNPNSGVRWERGSAREAAREEKPAPAARDRLVPRVERALSRSPRMAVASLNKLNGQD